MSKEYLEAFEVIKNKFIDLFHEDIPDFDTVENALNRLESIDNAKPSEALNCLEYICKILNEKRIDVKWLFKYDYNTIKQVLLKVQEPKHYLKWDDLEFTRDEKVMTVKMGDTVYKVLYRCCDGIEEVQLLSKDEKLLCLNLIGKYKDNIQLFNDLHLERTENNNV